MSIPFIDLKSQYQELKTDINTRIQKVLDHGQYILGPEVKECEDQLSKFSGSPYAVTCASGTDALILALMAIDVQPGDEVIVPAFSFFATAESVSLLKAIPVFVDIDPVTYNLNPSLIEEAITSKTKVIMPVSLYGQTPDMDSINKIAKKHNLVVIEDSAQSFGAKYKDKKSCNISDFGATSFFPAKPLGCYGDGGAVFTNNKDHYEKLLSIRNHGQAERYNHVRLGINGRLDTIQCAILISKLQVYEKEIINRESAARYYTEKLSQIDGLTTPYIHPERSSVWAQYTLRVKNRENFQKKMNEFGVPTAVHYPSVLSAQPAMKEISRIQSQHEALIAAKEVVSLPMHPYLDKTTQDKIIEAVKKSV